MYRKRKKKLSTEKQWIDHCKTLQRLSTPKQIGSLCFPSRGKKVPLHKLRLRINYLSQPRKPIKKRQYVKNPDDFKLPGAIKDWNAHSKWLLKIAQPRVRDNDPKVTSNKDYKYLVFTLSSPCLTAPKTRTEIKTSKAYIVARSTEV